MFKQIVVGTDGSAGANIAVDAAIELARLTGATLHIVTAYQTATSAHLAAAAQVGIPAVDLIESETAIRANAQRVCDQSVERASSAGVSSEVHAVLGDAADALLRVGEDAGADLLVVGNRGMSGVRRFVLGSVPNRLSHHCPSNLLIVDTSGARQG
jgi:nucleotide-binding universal stress UspA family protein